MSLTSKLEGDNITNNLLRQCRTEVEELHAIFVSWFQGNQPKNVLEQELKGRLQYSFSHVAPNGQSFSRRKDLFNKINDMYSVYQDRLFKIDIFNVQLKWYDSQESCLCTYEEWQSWNQVDEEGNENLVQLGRLSSCLLEKVEGRLTWVHVHETWLEAESPPPSAAAVAAKSAALREEDESVMTGPVEPQVNNSIQLQQQQKMPPPSEQHPANLLYNNKHDDDDDDDDDDENNNEYDRGQERIREEEGGGKVILLVLISGLIEGEQAQRQDTALSVLKDNRVLCEIVDGTDYDKFDHRNYLIGLSGIRGYPQLFLRQDNGDVAFWGGWEKFEAVMNAQTILDEFPLITGPNVGDNQMIEQAATSVAAGSKNDHIVEEEKPELRSMCPGDKQSTQEGTSEKDKLEKPTDRADDASEEEPKEQAEIDNVVEPEEPDKVQNEGHDEGHKLKGIPERRPTTFPPHSGSDDGQGHLLILISSQNMSKDQASHQSRALNFLKMNDIVYLEVDGADYQSHDRRNDLFELSGIRGKYPQFFIEKSGKSAFWGDWDRFKTAKEAGTLKADLIAAMNNSPLVSEEEREEGANEEEKEEEVGEEQASRGMTALSKATNRDDSAEETKPEQLLETEGILQKDEKDGEGQESAHKLRGMPERRPTTFPPHQSSDDGQAHLLALLSSQNLSKEQISHQSRAILFLNVNHIPYLEVDGADYNEHNRRNDLFEVSGLRGKYPQFFIQQNGRAVFWGDWTKLEASNDNGTLQEDLNNAISKGVKDDEGAKIHGVECKAPEQPSRESSKPDGKKELSPAESEKRPLTDNAAVKDEAKQMDKEEDRNLSKAASAAGPAPEKSARKIPELSTELPAEEVMLESLESQSPIPQDASSNRQFCNISSELSKYAKPLMWEDALVGVSINGFDIGSSQGPLADEKWYEETGNYLEELAQSRSMPKPCRHICLPATVFPMAHVAVEGNGYWLIWDANEALEEWARCHQEIAINSRESYNGVSVMRAKDTKYWEQKRKHGKYLGLPSVFHYDWSFSTPFCDKVEGGSWHGMKESGMKLSLLSDSSLPVLFYDDIVMYEDDIHNNGQVKYTVKIRVTPSYSYVLSRLWICLAKVFVRLRECRVMIDYTKPVAKVCRDINWRECNWSDLAANKLPTDAESWNQESPSWQKQMTSLPECDLPKGMPKYAALLPF